MKIIKPLAVLFGILLAASAAASSHGKVEKLEFGPLYGSTVYVDITGKAGAACATNQAGYDYHFDAALPAGQIMYAALLASQRAGADIFISGTGSCDAGSQTEGIRWMQTPKD